MKTNSQTQKITDAIVTDGVGTDIFLPGTAVGACAMAAGIIGAWSVSCLVSAVIVAGGPLNLAANWFQAISGM